MKTSTKQEQSLFALLHIFLIPGIISSPTCSMKICLRWTLKPGILKLTCKIDNPHLPVSIHNNFGKEIAICGLPFPSPICSSGNKNTTVRQNVHTNETVVTIRATIDQRINGNWSCFHGSGRNKYEADLEINIPIIEDLLCLKEISFYSMTGISILVVTFSIVYVLSICKDLVYNWKKEKTNKGYIEVTETNSSSKPDGTKTYMHDKSIVFCVCSLLVVLLTGSVIGYFEKRSCNGSFVFIIVAVSVCLTLLILFVRSKAPKQQTHDETTQDIVTEGTGVVFTPAKKKEVTCSENPTPNLQDSDEVNIGT